MSIFGLIDVLDRAHKGPVCKVKDWDSKVIPKNVMDKLKKYRLEKTFDPKSPINCDDSLANNFFTAGFELATDLGMLCIDTERIIKFSEDELGDIVERAKPELKFGFGKDQVTMRARRPEDPTKPLFLAPLGIVVSEDLYLQMVQGIAMNKEVDMMSSPTIETIFGRPLLGGTPYETLAGRHEAQMNREALSRAGRQGMSVTVVLSSTTEYGQLGGLGVPGGYDPAKDFCLVLSPAELKTSYSGLHKVAHALNYGSIIRGGATSFIGGYFGPPEGAAVGNIAFHLLQFAVHQASFAGCDIQDLRYEGATGREALWANSVAIQALSLNSHLLIDKIINQTAGPCTDILLYECAVSFMTMSVSGASSGKGPRSACGRLKDHLTPLECKFSGQVLKACAGMSRKNANEIALELIPLYEGRLKSPPDGKSARQCYDFTLFRPSDEWQGIYDKVKGEIAALGIKF